MPSSVSIFTSTQGKFPCTTAVLTRVIFINLPLWLLVIGS
jgi:hypothetical protein